MRTWTADRCLLVVAFVVANSAATGCTTRAMRQHGSAHVLRPAEIRSLSEVPPSNLRTMRVRAYADADFQAHAVDWQARIEDLIRRASKVVEGDFGIHLELESVRRWSRSDLPLELLPALQELVLTDPGEDVDWVIGLVRSEGAGAAAGADREQVGRARFFSRHFVLRAMESPGDEDRARVSWDTLTDDERTTMLAEHRRHAETVMFLHEWGHTLGAVHECNAKYLMNPSETLLTSGFSPESIRLIRVGLEHRERLGPGSGEWLAAFDEAAGDLGAAEWNCELLAAGLKRARRELAQLTSNDVEEWLDWYGERALLAAVRRYRATRGEGATPPAGTKIRVSLSADGGGVELQRVSSTGSEAVDRELDAALAPIRPPAPPRAPSATPALDRARAEITMPLPAWALAKPRP